jgi:nitroreductase
MSDLTTIIRQRRSIKPADMDAERAIPADTLNLILENATWAPTHGLTEPWRFHVFQGPARTTLAKTLQATYRATTPPKQHREDKFAKLGTTPLLAPVVIAACMKRLGGEKIPAHEEYAAVACAVQNLMLTATAQGIASYWSSPPVTDTQEFKQTLNLTAEDRCLGLIYLGWQKGTAPTSKMTRKPLSECVVWEGTSGQEES